MMYDAVWDAKSFASANNTNLGLHANYHKNINCFIKHKNEDYYSFQIKSVQIVADKMHEYKIQILKQIINNNKCIQINWKGYV